MQLYREPILNRHGEPVFGVSVTVKTSTGSLAALFSADGLSIANPVTTDANGEAPFKAANGNYAITVSGVPGQGSSTRTLALTLNDPDDASAATLAQLAAPSGAGLVNFILPGSGAVSATVDSVLREQVSVFRFMTPAQIGNVVGGAGTMDLTTAIQAAINYCMKQYDPTQTTHDGNNWTYKGLQKTLFFPDGLYRVTGTLNIKFRNEIEMVGESMYGTVIRWDGADNGMMIDARCSNYVKLHNFTLDGAHKALTMIYHAGNGVNAVNSKGNVTGNAYESLYLWNQIGYLTGIAPDYPDQYNPLSAMLCLTSIEGISYYNSMDDSSVRRCRFAPNSLNNNYSVAVSSSTVPISDSWFGGANGLLIGNGTQQWITNCVFSTYAPAVMDATHHHAVLKFNATGIAFAQVTMKDCYHESMDYYNGGVNGNSSVLVYMAPGASGLTDNMAKIHLLLISGGLYSCNKDNVNYIDIGANNRANIKIDKAAFQGAKKGYIFAPDSSVEVIQISNASATNSYNSKAWQVSSSKNVRNDYTTPDFRICGQRTADVVVTVGATNDPALLKFTSMDDALPFISSTKAMVTLYLEKNDTISNPITLDANIFLALQGYTLTVNAAVKNFGQLSITSAFANATRAGAITGTNCNLINYGSMTLKNTSITNLVTANGGRALFDNIAFLGASDVVALGDAAEVIINQDNCTYTATGFVVNLGSKFSKAIIRSSYGATPTTGKWMRGTCVEFTNPSTGFPNLYWATTDGTGAAATWAKIGNLS